MINRLMKKIGEKALKDDLAKIDPSRLPEGITEIKDIPYLKYGHPSQTLDVYLRRDGLKKPILIDIHGGGFITEDKAMNRMFGNYMSFRTRTNMNATLQGFILQGILQAVFWP